MVRREILRQPYMTAPKHPTLHGATFEFLASFQCARSGRTTPPLSWRRGEFIVPPLFNFHETKFLVSIAREKRGVGAIARMLAAPHKSFEVLNER